MGVVSTLVFMCTTWYDMLVMLMCTQWYSAARHDVDATLHMVRWGGVGCVNVGVHVYTWYAAGVLMCTHGTWGGVGWGVSTLVFMCTHGTLLVC